MKKKAKYHRVMALCLALFVSIFIGIELAATSVSTPDFLMPEATITTTNASCVGKNVQADAQINLSEIVGDRVGIVAGTDYDLNGGASYAAATELGGATTYDFTNLSQGTDYVVRIYDGSNTSFQDYPQRTNTIDCTMPCDCVDYVYLNDTDGANLVHKFSIDPVTGDLTEIGSPWLPTGTINDPHGLAMDLNGFLYVGEPVGRDGTGGTTDFGFSGPSSNIFRLNCDGMVMDDDFIGTELRTWAANFTASNGYLFVPNSIDETIDAYELCTGTYVGSMYVNNGNDIFTWGFYIEDGTWYVPESASANLFTGATDISLYTDPPTQTGTLAFNLGFTPNFDSDVPMGITRDIVGNYYLVRNGISGGNSNVQVRKYDPNGVFLASVNDPTSNVQSSDGQAGFYGARGITYSRASNQLYVSALDNCVAVFDTNLVQQPSLNVGNALNSRPKGIGLLSECCPVTNLTLNETVCFGGTPIKYFLNEVFDCGDGAICEGQWAETADANDFFDFNECDLSITITGSGCSTYQLAKTTAATGNQRCGTFEVNVTVCTVQPAATVNTTDATCDGLSLNNDARVNLTAITGDRVSIIAGTDYTAAGGDDYANATDLGGATTYDFTNLTAGTDYVVRIFNEADDCFTDYTITTNTPVCRVCRVQVQVATTGCTDNGDGTFTTDYQVTVDWLDAPNPAEMIDVRLDGASIGTLATTPNGAGSDNSLTFQLPADGTGNYLLTAAFNTSSDCLASTRFDAPFPCPNPAPPCVGTSGCLGGNVFNDFNCNGVDDNEPGIESIEINIYAADNNLLGTTFSDQDGNWQFCDGITDGMAYRVEFVTLPNMDWLVPTIAGASNGTDVQFANAPACFNFSLNNPNDYCDSTPELITPCYLLDGANNGDPAVISFDYNASGQTTVYDEQGSFGTTGATYGVAYDRSQEMIYSSAYFKIQAAYGSGSPGAIYQLPRTAGVAGEGILVDLNTLSGFNGTGADTHVPTGTNGATFYDETADANNVGKLSLGDLELSADQRTLYAVNMNTRELVSIPVGAGVAAPTSAAATNTLPAPGQVGQFTIPSPCSNPDDARPMALEVHQGRVYVGGICSAESTVTGANPAGDPTQLTGYIYEFDPSTGSFSGLVFTFPLNYDRSVDNVNYVEHLVDNSFGNPVPGTWRVWGNNQPIMQGNSNLTSNPMPMLADFEFDNDGSIIIGLRDRWGDMGLLIRQANGSIQQTPVAGGDLLRAQLNAPGNWTIVDNTNGDGFYFEDNFDSYGEITLGALALLPSTNDITVTVYNPFETFSGGIEWYDNETGAYERGYELFSQNQANTTAKGNGFGDLALLCGPAPLEIGNYVWCDDDENGIQDANEVGVDGINVQLYDRNGVLVGVTTTANGGFYYFNQNNVDSTGVNPDGTATTAFTGMSFSTNYTIVFGNAQFSGDNFTTTTGIYGITPLHDVNSNTNDNVDSDVNPNILNASSLPFIALTTDAQGCADHSYDLGLSCGSVSLGSTVFVDNDNNGVQDGTDSGIPNVLVVLYMDGGDGATDGTDDTAIVTGADGIVGTADDTWGPDGIQGNADDGQPGMFTNAMGNYFFAGIRPGDYYVQIPTSQFGPGAALEDLPLSSNTLSGFAGETDPDDDTDNDDEGLQTTSGGATTSQIITLDVGTEPTDTTTETAQGSDQDNAPDYLDADGNMTLDFGFFAPVSLGNYTWIDTDMDGTQDGGEPVLANVTVTLFNADGTPVTQDAAGNPYTNTTTTNSMGLYTFSDLPPGDYYAVFDLSTAPGGNFYNFTANTGADETTNSDADPATGQSDNSGFILSGTNYPHLDAGVICAVAADAGTGQTICTSAAVNLSSLGARITPNDVADFGATWTSNGSGTFDDGAGRFGVATTYTPSAADAIVGMVTLTLTTDDPRMAPFNAATCGPATDEVSIIILRVNCGMYPWDGD
ncbi:MAG: SdrD B-like domain-containing protein [Bacteroidota bacterium]